MEWSSRGIDWKVSGSSRRHFVLHRHEFVSLRSWPCRGAFLSTKKPLSFFFLSSLYFVSFPFGSQISCLISRSLLSLELHDRQAKIGASRSVPREQDDIEIIKVASWTFTTHHSLFYSILFLYFFQFFSSSLSPIAESVISRFPVFV